MLGSRVRERGGGHTQNRAGVGECVASVRGPRCLAQPAAAGTSAQPSRAQPWCFLLRRALRGCWPGGRAPAILGACLHPRPAGFRAGGTASGRRAPFGANNAPPPPASPGFRGFLGGAGAGPAVMSRRGSPAGGCLLPFLTMEIPAVAIAPALVARGWGGGGGGDAAFPLIHRDHPPPPTPSR